jgi:SagB-type dehydrogenase family enzyme
LDCEIGRCWKTSSIRFIHGPEGLPGLRAPETKPRRQASATLSARLPAHITLESRPDGELAACFFGHSVDLGKFSPGATNRAQKLRTGLPLSAFSSGRRKIDKEIQLLVQRLAKQGLLEFCLGRSPGGDDLAVIEPQTPDYWPKMPPLLNADTLVLSRFAYMRRRGSDIVLESPRAGALFRLRDPNIAAALALLSKPQHIKQLRRYESFPGTEFLALLVDCQILFRTETADDGGLRSTEGDDNLVLWDFHDLLFHARSTEGRHANPLGGLYPYAGLIAPLPAIRPRWPGKKIDLRKSSTAQSPAISPIATQLRQRHSTRSFDDQRPITLAELAQFLDGTARVQSEMETPLDFGDEGPVVTYAVRPYPSAGAAYELELYLGVGKCEGLARGFYHYDAGGHALVPITVHGNELETLLLRAAHAMAVQAAPQVVITVAARFGRTSWKYSSIAYSLILKDVGALLQTFYLMASDMGLGGCAIGSINIDLFAKMTGLEFYVEGPVGQFAIGRGAIPEAPRGSM